MLASRRGGRGVKRDLGALVDREHDLLVVGGGIYGAAAAWDAAQRGLAVALVEKADFGGGASWNSLKTIHGGLRHLQRLEIRLLRESARERAAFHRVAPALIRPLPVLVPCYGHGPRGREALAAGLWLFERLAGGAGRDLPAERRPPPARMLSAAEVRERVPGVPADRLTGGAFWHDAQAVASERLLIAFLQAAAGAGAVLANAVEVRELVLKGRRVVGAAARDHEASLDLVLRARVVLNATGPGVDGLLRRAGIARPAVPLLRAFNLVLRRPVGPPLAVGATSRGRHLFLAPWRDRAILGTEYEDAGSPGDTGRLAGFLADAQAAFPWASLSAADVSLVHSGLVPGRGDGAGLFTGSRIVDHADEHGLDGLVSILGAKYTTARAVAERALDLVGGRLGRSCPPCRTATTPLPVAAPEPGGLAAEALRAVREEMALHLSDVVLRRTELGSGGLPAPAAVEAAAAVVARELGWDAARLAAEHQALRAELRAHDPATLIESGRRGSRQRAPGGAGAR